MKELVVCMAFMFTMIWDVVNGEELICEREPTNKRDEYAVAVIKQDEVVGHLPRKICSLNTSKLS